MKRPSFLIALCILPWALAIAALGWLALQRFPPSGVITFRVPFDGRSAWINPFLPGERVSSPGAQDGGAWRGQRIIGDPVYATARVPGVYETVEIAMEFRPLRQPLVELGVIRGADVNEIEFTPLWFEPLHDKAWVPITGGYRLDGTRTSSDTRTTAVWRTSSTMPLLSDPASDMKKTRVTLRGAHDFYAVPAGGRVAFTFEIQDVNRGMGPDTVAFRLWRGADDLGTEALGIGGSRDTKMGTVTEKTIEIRDADPGVYRVQVLMDDDVFIRSVSTNAKHWVVGPRLVFGDDVGFEPTTKPGVAWTDSRHLVLETFHKEGLQKITLGKAGTDVIRTHDLFYLHRTDKETAPLRLDAPKGDIRIIGDSWFSFTPEAWFAPQPRRITDSSDPKTEGATTVLTPYVRPESLEDGWVRGYATFRLDPAQDIIRLALSAPGIVTRSGAVDIRNVTLTYRRPPLTLTEWVRIARQEVGNAIRRLR